MMTFKHIIAMGGLSLAALAMIPLSTLGLVYGLIAGCVLLAVLPFAVETLMTDDIKGEA